VGLWSSSDLSPSLWLGGGDEGIIVDDEGISVDNEGIRVDEDGVSPIIEVEFEFEKLLDKSGDSFLWPEIFCQRAQCLSKSNEFNLFEMMVEALPMRRC
jgi:hypothetical protein